MRGDGSIYTKKNSALLWCKYYLRGVPFRESTGESDPEKAKKYLRNRLREVGADLIGARPFVGPAAERIRVSCSVPAEECDCLCCALERDLELRGKASVQNVSNVSRVRRDFGAMTAIAVTEDTIDTYIARRLKDGAAPASINRCTQLLGQAFKLAVRRRRLQMAPFIRHLSEKGNVRQGFFAYPEFKRVVEHLPDYLQDFARFAYITGMRRGEIASLTWTDVDDGDLRLRAEEAKNGESRGLPLEEELAEVIERRRAARPVKREGRVVLVADRLFHRDGAPIREFRKSWKTACCMAGIGSLVCRKCKGAVDAEYNCAKCKKAWKRDELKYLGRLFHDFRRSAVRDMVRAGTPESVAMKISGHKTQSMFTRYNIASDADMRQALKATREYREAQAAKVTAMPKASAGVN